MPTRQMQPYGAQRHVEENAEVLRLARNWRNRCQNGGDHEKTPLWCPGCCQLQLFPQETQMAEERNYLQVRHKGTYLFSGRALFKLCS